jgi:hypothetical protein
MSKCVRRPGMYIQLYNNNVNLSHEGCGVAVGVGVGVGRNF